MASEKILARPWNHQLHVHWKAERLLSSPMQKEEERLFRGRLNMMESGLSKPCKRQPSIIRIPSYQSRDMGLTRSSP